MYTIITWEVFLLLVSFVLFYKLKLEKKFISLIFHKMTIYLPLTDGDYEKLLSIKKDKTQKSLGIVRSCEIDEYITNTNEETYYDFDIIVLFFLCNIFTLLINEFKVVLQHYLLYSSSIFGEPSEETSFNIISSFAFITFGYYLYIAIRKHVFKTKRDSTISLFIFSLAFALMLSVLVFKEEVINIDYKSVIDVVNDRVNKIITAMKTELISYDSIKPLHIKIFFASVFAMTISSLYRSAMRNAYFDHFILISSEKNEADLSKLHYVLKSKLILSIFNVFILIDPLFINFFDMKSMKGFVTYFSILFIGFIVEFILAAYMNWYSAFMFHVQNYAEMIRFSKDPSKRNLMIVRQYIGFINSKFWEVMISEFFLIYCPLFAVIAMLSRGRIVDGLMNGKLVFRTGFFECCIYFVLMGIMMAKGVMSNGYMFYLMITKKLKCAIY